MEQRRKRGCRYFVKLFLVASLGLCPIFTVIVAVKGIFDVNEWIYPVSPDTPAEPGLDLGAAYEEVEFQTEDGLTLRGWYVPPQNGAAIIVIHHLNSNRNGILRVPQILIKHGYGALIFDVRKHGNSDGEKLSHVWYDGLAAVDYLQQQPEIEHIGMYGFSLGGLIALQAAALDENIEAVMVDGPGPARFEDMPSPQSFAEWLYVPYDLTFFASLQSRSGGWTPASTREAITEIAPRPIYFVSMAGERSDQRAEQRMVQGFYDAASEPKFLWQIPDVGHGLGIIAYPEEYEQRMIEFFDNTLLGHSD